MPTPPKKRVVASADAAMLVDKLQELSDWFNVIHSDIEDVIRFRSLPNKLKTDRERFQKILNEGIFQAKKIEHGLGEECQMNFDAILNTHKNGTTGLPPKDKMTIDTDLGKSVGNGWLIPRVGRAECLARIAAAKPKTKFNFIPESVANKCFGFTGSESNFLRSWMNVQFYHGTRDEVETYGSLSYDSRRRGFKYDDVKTFAEVYYPNFYLWQVELFRMKQKAFVECNGEKELQGRS